MKKKKCFERTSSVLAQKQHSYSYK